MAFLDVSLRGSESRRICIEGGVVISVPTTRIKVSEVVPPVEIEALVLTVPSVSFNVVVLDVPGHISSIQALPPRLKSRRPEVHHDRLTLFHVLNGGIGAIDPPDFLVINRPSYIVGCPGHLIDMPVIAWIEPTHIVVSLTLRLVITVDNVH